MKLLVYFFPSLLLIKGRVFVKDQQKRDQHAHDVGSHPSTDYAEPICDVGEFCTGCKVIFATTFNHFFVSIFQLKRRFKPGNGFPARSAYS